MATLNPFQQYSQGENTVTNNVLLMFSMLYEVNPKYYEEYINSILEENDFYHVIPIFSQQFNNKGNGIIDGHIQMMPSSIIIETKLGGVEWVEKLLKYTQSFQANERKILIHLSRDQYDLKQIAIINERLSKSEETKNVKFTSLTYNDLLEHLEALRNLYQFESSLQKIHSSFDSYIRNMNLISDNRHILRAMACGQSHELNVKYQFYFDLKERGYRRFDYLGIYFWKSVRYIGEVENVIVADYDDVNGLQVFECESPLTQQQSDRLITAIKESINEGWSIEQGHRFFLLKDFQATDFKKVSSGGIFRVRYFYLETEPGIVVNSVSQVADDLRQYDWA